MTTTCLLFALKILVFHIFYVNNNEKIFMRKHKSVTQGFIKKMIVQPLFQCRNQYPLHDCV